MHTHLRRLSLAVAVAAVFVGAINSGKGDGPVVAASGSGKSLAPVKANEPLTMNALLGFVNAEPVFVHDVLRPIDENLREIARKARDVSDFRDEARVAIESQLRMYVSDILIMSNAKSALTDEDKQRIDVYMNLEKSKLISKHGGSEAMANQALKAEGSSVDKELRDTRRHLTVDLYLNKTLYPKIQITWQMVQDEYQRTLQKWRQGAEIELYTLTLPVSRYLPKEPGQNGQIGPAIAHPTAEQVKQAQAEAMTVAGAVIEQLKKGANFAQMVQDYNSRDDAADKGGRMGHVKKGSLAIPKLEEYAFSLPANTVGSEPLLVSEGGNLRVMVIKVGEKKEARTVPFSEAQKPIEQEMRETLYRQLYREYLQKLYNAAAIEKVDVMADVAIDVAVARYATQ